MNNAPALLKTLVTFALIVPLAVFVGYTLTNPLDYTTFGFGSVLGVILAFPLLLRWHHPLLVLSWNLSATVFFLPGRPNLFLVMALASMGISLGQRAMGGLKFISVPQVTWSLIGLLAVAVFTARMTGMGLRSMGSEVYGGKRYVFMLGGIIAYFALSVRRIPPERAGLYVGLFCLAGLTGILTDLSVVVPGFLRFIYLIFPGNYYAPGAGNLMNSEPLRLGGASSASFAIFSYMLAKYGIRGIFLSGKFWRWLFFSLALLYVLFGGFRGMVMFFAMMFALQFYLEGLYRTKLLPIFTALGIVLAIPLVLLTPQMPLTVQRALAFLPLQIDPQMQQQANQSLDWRLDMWKAVLPQIPHYLLLGKGYSLSVSDFQLMGGADAAIHSFSGFEENQFYAVAGAYHNGPLSVIMTFGIWGVITFGWFVTAGFWVLYRNYRYGDPALQKVNLFLLVAFASRFIYFLTIFGELDLDIMSFGGWLGLSVGLNGGVCHPAPVPALAANRYPALAGVRSHLQPAFRRPNIRA